MSDPTPAVEPFALAVSDEELEDLRDRLARTRWPDAEPVDDWSQGLPLAYAQELCAYWADGYDLRRLASRLDAVGQFHTVLDGVDVHFLHRRSPHPDALPLLLTHGWPGSVVEFLKVIEPLVDPVAHGGRAQDAFHVVCPSLPGYGFSAKPTEAGCGTARIARAWTTLMERLEYPNYVAQGGDWGAVVTMRLAQQRPAGLQGIHLNMPVVGRDAIVAAGEPTAEEQRRLAAFAEHRRTGSGYMKQQATRPQTLGYGLVDSPAAQCAWIVEKFWAWTDNAGHPEDALTRDELLDNVMMYWLPGTGASSARLYWESVREPDHGTVDVPTALSIFPHELTPVSRRWAEQRFTDLRYYRELDRGGHFAAFEQPELFAQELRDGFASIR